MVEEGVSLDSSEQEAQETCTELAVPTKAASDPIIINIPSSYRLKEFRDELKELKSDFKKALEEDMKRLKTEFEEIFEDDEAIDEAKKALKDIGNELVDDAIEWLG